MLKNGFIVTFISLSWAVPCFATSWTFSQDSQCTTLFCNDGYGNPTYGVLTAVEASTGASFTDGTYTRTKTGFLQLNIPADANPGTGAWKQPPPFSVYAVEIPGVGTFTPPLLATENQVIVTVANPTCASTDFSGNFLVGQWSQYNDMSQAGQLNTGYLNWNNASSFFSLQKMFNVTAWADFLSGATINLHSSGCVSGQYTFTGSGDRGGQAWIGAQNSAIYRSQLGHTFYEIPAAPVGNAATLFGSYAAIRYDSFSGASHPILPMQVVIDSSGSAGSSNNFSDPSAGTLATGGNLVSETLTITAIDSPQTGMIEAVLHGSYTAKVTCVVGLNLTDSIVTKNAVICAGQSASDSSRRSPMNLYLVSAKDYPAGQDHTFDNDGLVSINVDSGSAPFSSDTVVFYTENLVIQPDQKILALGSVSNWAAGGRQDMLLYRVNPNGSLDTSFNSTGKLQTVFSLSDTSEWVSGLGVQSSGKIVVGGTSSSSGNSYFTAMRFNSDGSIDSTFSLFRTTIGSSPASANAMTIQADQKIILGGDYTSLFQGRSSFALVRLLSNGFIDTSFNTSGVVTTNVGPESDYLYKVATQPDGKIIALGSTSNSGAINLAMVRYLSNGSLDTSFNGTGIVTLDGTGELGYVPNSEGYDVAIRPTGEILVSGYSSYSGNQSMVIAQYTSSGVLDTTFNGTGYTDYVDGSLEAWGIGIQPDGKVVAVGNQIGGGINPMYIRFNADGTLDSTYFTSVTGNSGTPNGGFTGSTTSMALDTEGRLILLNSKSKATLRSYNLYLFRLWP